MELEDFMRQQFNGEDPAERFPFRAEYWEQAKVLLEAAEQQSKRRKFFWWCLGVGIVLLVSTGVYLTRCGTPSSRHPWKADRFGDNNPSHTQREASQAKTGAYSGSTADDRADMATFGVSNTKAPSPAFKTMEIPNLPRPPRNHSRKPAAPNPIEITAGAEKKSILGASSLPDARRIASTDKTNPPDGMTGVEGTTDTTGRKTALIQSGLEALPSLDFVLLQPNIHTPERPEVQNIRPAKAERSGLGVVVGTPIYPDAPNGRQVGAVVGLYVASDFRGRWMLSLGVQWRYRPVASIETILTDHQLRYSFGYTLDEWRRQNWAVHYLEAPLCVQRHWYRRNVEVGFVPGMMLGATDRLVRQRSTLFPEETKMLETKYLDGNKLQYRPLYIAAFAGGGWTCCRRLELYGRIFYRPDGVRKKRSDGGGLDGKIWPEMGLRIGL